VAKFISTGWSTGIFKIIRLSDVYLLAKNIDLTPQTEAKKSGVTDSFPGAQVTKGDKRNETTERRALRVYF